MRTGLLLSLSAGALAAGCGDEDEPDRSAERAKAKREAAKRLPKPIHPTCGTEAFPSPQIRPIDTPDGGRVWTLGYTLGAADTKKVSPGDTTNMVIVQYPAAGGAAAQPGSPMRTIAGRRVAFRAPGGKNKAFAAQWKTRRARYTVIANGTKDRTIKRIIGCLP